MPESSTESTWRDSAVGVNHRLAGLRRQRGTPHRASADRRSKSRYQTLRTLRRLENHSQREITDRSRGCMLIHDGGSVLTQSSGGCSPTERYNPRHMSHRIRRQPAPVCHVSTAEARRPSTARTGHARCLQKGRNVNEGDGSDLIAVVTGRVKVFKTTPRGTDVILELFGREIPSEPSACTNRGPIRPAPSRWSRASCLLIPRTVFFALLEQSRWCAAFW